MAAKSHSRPTVKPEIFECPRFGRLQLSNYFGVFNFRVFDLLAELLVIVLFADYSRPVTFANLLRSRNKGHAKISGFTEIYHTWTCYVMYHGMITTSTTVAG